MTRSPNYLTQLPNYPITRFLALSHRSSSSSSAEGEAGANRLRRGGGILETAPLTERQRISFKRPSGARSSREKSIESDSCAPKADVRFFSSIGTRGCDRRYFVRNGIGVNA